MDKIYIRDLQLKTVIGTFPHERNAKQDVIINITIFCELDLASKSDSLNDTVNYKEIKLAVKDLVENSEYLLIEKLAGEIANLVLKTDKVEGCTVTVDKPHALRFSQSVAVEITRYSK